MEASYISSRRRLVRGLVAAVATLTPSIASAHGVATGDKGYLQEVSGILLVPFAYLGAKHMVTGYDHLLFLVGVIFYLYRLKDVAVYVTLFAVGHSVTLISGVLLGVSVNPFLIDAIIGLSVVYKAMDNLKLFDKWFGTTPDARTATLIFGLIHGIGLATKIRDFEVSPEGLVSNLVAFNVGVEIGQLLALSAILIAITAWRRSGSFERRGGAANVVLLVAGFALTVYQIVGFFALQPV